jgi:deoxycytidylate deaminase
MPSDNHAQDQDDPFRAQEYPELVFGIVAPLGIDLDQLIKFLQEELQRVGYVSTVIRLSKLLELVSGLESTLNTEPEHQRIRSHMHAGTELRTRTKEGGILARLAVAAIQQERKLITGDANRPAEKRAYILRSLKHKDEVNDLRDVYGDGFVTISAYSPKKNRERALMTLLSKSEPDQEESFLRTLATELIEIDESEEGKELGQNVEGAFPLADFFVNASDLENLRENIKRSIEIFFGNHFRTPTRDEFGMYLAAAAARRSADLSRQVGAALVTQDWEIISVGCNDIPKAGGGLYWAGDSNDGRDFALLG